MIRDLEPCSVYYVRAYGIRKSNGSVVYGEPVKIVTIPKGEITWTYETGEGSNEEYDTNLQAALAEAVDNWNISTSIRGFHPSLHYVDEILCQGLVTQALGEDGLPIKGRFHSAAYVLDFEEGTKYYLKPEAEEYGAYTHVVKELTDGSVDAVAMRVRRHWKTTTPLGILSSISRPNAIASAMPPRVAISHLLPTSRISP